MDPQSPRRAGQPGAGRDPTSPSAARSGADADKLTAFAHELGNLLDGSLRCLGLAQRALPTGESHPDPRHTDPSDARRQLQTLRLALERMSELVDAAMRAGTGSAMGGGNAIPPAPVELGEALFHAVDVLAPLAAEHAVAIRARVSNGLAGIPAGPLYGVMVNAITNAIEAIALCRADNHQPGSIDVAAEWIDDGRIRITVTDDGVGPPDDSRLFTHGFSTKPSGAGLGLALAAAIVRQLPDGEISLTPRPDRASLPRPGAVFEVRYRPVLHAPPSSGAGPAA